VKTKHERIRITTAGEEAFRAPAFRQKFGAFSYRKALRSESKGSIDYRENLLSTLYRRTLC